MQFLPSPPSLPSFPLTKIGKLVRDECKEYKRINDNAEFYYSTKTSERICLQRYLTNHLNNYYIIYHCTNPYKLFSHNKGSSIALCYIKMSYYCLLRNNLQKVPYPKLSYPQNVG